MKIENLFHIDPSLHYLEDNNNNNINMNYFLPNLDKNYIDLNLICEYAGSEDSEGSKLFSDMLDKEEEENPSQQNHLSPIYLPTPNTDDEDEQFTPQRGALSPEIRAKEEYFVEQFSSELDDLSPSLQTENEWSSNNALQDMFPESSSSDLSDNQHVEEADTNVGKSSTYSRKREERKRKKCSKEFHCRRYSEQHEATRHVKPSKKENEKEKASKKYIDKKIKECTKLTCDFCHKTIANKRGLKDHIMSIHMGEKRYQCKECKHCFPNASNLSKHQKTHSEIKQFKCDKCHKCFVVKRYLKAHLDTHSNERKFNCDNCQKNYKHLKSLHSHKEKVHGQQYTVNSTDDPFRKIFKKI